MARWLNRREVDYIIIRSSRARRFMAISVPPSDSESGRSAISSSGISSLFRTTNAERTLMTFTDLMTEMAKTTWTG